MFLMINSCGQFLGYRGTKTYYFTFINMAKVIAALVVTCQKPSRKGYGKRVSFLDMVHFKIIRHKADDLSLDKTMLTYVLHGCDGYALRCRVLRDFIPGFLLTVDVPFLPLLHSLLTPGH